MTNIIISWQGEPQIEGWNGTHWDSNEPIFECAGPFESKNIAGEWAYENNPQNY